MEIKNQEKEYEEMHAKEIKLKNGDAAYKASIDPITKECYYAKRHSGFEVRDIQVVQENEYELIETDKIVIKN